MIDRKKIGDQTRFCSVLMGRIKNDIENVKKTKLGDCGESCSLTLASLIANGIKNFKIGLLTFNIDIKKTGQSEIYQQKNYNTTHEMVVLNSNEDYIDNKSPKSDVIILDAWLNFCGNIQKANDIFYETFLSGFRKYKTPEGYECIYRPKIKLYSLNIEQTDELTKSFAEKYPELIIKNGK